MEDVRFCSKCHHSIVSCGCDKNYVLKEDVELYPEWISGQGEQMKIKLMLGDCLEEMKKMGNTLK